MKRASSLLVVLIMVATAFFQLQILIFQAPTAAGYVFNTPVNNTDVVFQGTESYGKTGYSVTVIDDLNTDLKDDIALGDPAASALTGRVVVYTGQKYTTWGTAPTDIMTGVGAFAKLKGEAFGDQLGVVVQGVGDTNNGGKGDFVATAPYHNETPATKVGAAYLVTGESLSYSASDQEVKAVAKFTIVGTDPNEFLGMSAARLGDVDGDGYDDYAVGAPGSKRCPGANRGAVFFLFGSQELTGKVTSTNVKNYVCGPADNYALGYSIVGGGDVNLDGYPDILLAAPSYSDVNTNVGRVSLIYGGQYLKKMTMSGPAVTEIEGSSFVGFEKDTYLGSYGTMALRGDFNGDRYADIVFGAALLGPGGSPRAGKVFLVHGQWKPWGRNVPIEGLGDSFFGQNSDDLLGNSVAYAGDTTGSGFHDIAVGATGYDGGGGFSNVGIIYNLRGRTNPWGANTSISTTGLVGESFIGMRSFNRVPSSLDGGDVNGDGLSDILVGDIWHEVGLIPRGGAYMISPKVNVPTVDLTGVRTYRNTDRESFLSVPTGQEVLIQVSGVSQVGIVDQVRVRVTVPGSGENITLTARETGVSTGVYETTLRLGMVTDRVARTLRVVPMTGSLSVDCPDATVVTSTTIAVNDDIHLYTVRNSFSTDRFKAKVGSTVAVLGDIFGQRKDAIAIRVMGSGSNPKDEVYIAESSAFHSNIIGMVDWLDNGSLKFVGRAGTDLGGAISGRADVNGDGRDDYLIGETMRTPDPKENRVYLLIGKDLTWGKTLPIDITATTIFKPATGDNGLASAVAMVGDMDGDGFDDLALGVPEAIVNGTDAAGAVFIFKGRATWPYNMMTSEADVVIQGSVAKGRLGSSVGGLGDINGDGLYDLVIGAPGENGALGMTYVLLGKRQGFDKGLPELAWPSKIPSSNVSFKITGSTGNPSIDPLFGWDVSIVGDVNGDDVDELAVLTAQVSKGTGSSQGMVHLFRGRETWSNLLDTDADIMLSAEGSTDALSIVTGAGDMDADGCDDLFIGAPKADGGWMRGGAAYLELGRPDLKQIPILKNADFKVWSEGVGDLGGASVDGGGDVDGDGYDDVIVGSPEFSGIGDGVGKAYVVSLKRGGFPAGVDKMDVFKDKAMTVLATTYVDMEDELWVRVLAPDTNPNNKDLIRVLVYGTIVDPNGIVFNLVETDKGTGTFVGSFKLKDFSNEGHRWLGTVPTDGIKIKTLNPPGITLNFTVDTHPEIIIFPDPAVAMEDAQFELEIGQKGTYNPTMTVSGIPSWLNKIGTGGYFYNGTPNNVQVGDTDIYVNLTDPFSKTVMRNFVLTVRNVAPAIIGVPPENATEGMSYLVDLASSDDGQGNITWSLENGPPGLSINNTTGVISGNLDDADVGAHIMTVSVNDGHASGITSVKYNLNVIGINDPPSITSAAVMVAYVDREYSYDVNASDNDTDSADLRYYLDIPPSGMTINPATGLITWTPAFSDVGDHRITVRVNDGIDNATQVFTLLVKIFTRPPSAVLVSPKDGETIPVLNPVLRWNGTDPDGQTITYDVYLSKSRLDVETWVAGARLTTAITNDFFQVNTLLEQGADYYWTIVPSDQADGEGMCTSGIWNFTVSRDAVVNSPPVINSIPPENGTVGVLYEYRIGAFDPDGANLTYILTSGPENMVLEENILHWTPRESDKPSVMVHIEVTDGLLSAVQEWNITVLNGTPNHPPVIDSIIGQNAEAGKRYEYTVKATDQDFGDELEFSLIQKPAGMTIDLNSGLITWTPNDDAVEKSFDVTVRVWDGKDKAETTFTITVKKSSGGTDGGTASSNLLFIILALLLIVVICGAVVYVAVSKKKKQRQDSLAEDIGKDETRTAPEGQVSEERPEPAPPEEPEVPMATATALAASVTEPALEPETGPEPVAAASEPVPEKGLAPERGKDVLVGWDLEEAGPGALAPAAEASEDSEIFSKEGYTLEKEAPVEAAAETPAVEEPAAAVEAPEPAPAEAAAEVRAPEEAKVAEQAAAPMAAATGGVAAAAAAAGAGAGIAAGGGSGEEVEHFSIDEMFVIYKDGRLISHTTTLESEQDKDVVSSMLVAVQTFVKDSFGNTAGGGGPGEESGSLESFTFSGRQIVMECGNYVILAVAMSGTEPPQLRELMRRTVQKMEGMYAGVIEEWDGSTDQFKDIVMFTAPIFKLGSTLRVKQKTEDVKVLSALEFFEGYVRLKLAVRNKFKAVITDATLTLKYNREALKLHHIEPDYPLDGRTVELGNIKPNEKKTVAFYLDPQICMESYIDCTLTYYDFEGKMHHVDMKRRPVDIVCPIFYTPKTVNVAMLRRLIGELRFKDSKFYILPKAMTPQQAFERSKNAIERHDIKFVREYVEEEVAGQYMGEAWYYGKTKTTEEELVIRTTVTQRDRSLEIFVASSNLASMTGLLSELGQNINQKTAGVAYKDENQIMVPTTGAAIREVSGERALLLDKYSSKELDAGADLETAGPTDPKRKKAGGMAPAGVQAPQPQPQQPPKPAGPKKDPLDDLDSLLKDL